MRKYMAFVMLAASFVASAQDKPRQAGVVTAVMGGDVIQVQLISGPVSVRLANIDAPETKQPGGADARMALFDRLIGEKVWLEVSSQDSNGSLVAVVYHDEESINGWMVKQGHAWADRRYADAPDYCVWESGARSLRRGLWAREEWLAPWEWRQGGRGKAIFYTDYRKATAASCIAEMRRP